MMQVLPKFTWLINALFSDIFGESIILGGIVMRKDFKAISILEMYEQEV